jgi:hypothetical protein
MLRWTLNENATSIRAAIQLCWWLRYVLISITCFANWGHTMPSVQLNTTKKCFSLPQREWKWNFSWTKLCENLFTNSLFFFQKYNSQLTELSYGLIVAFIRHKICYGASEKISEKLYYYNGDNCDHDKNSHNQCTKWKFISAGILPESETRTFRKTEKNKRM